MNKLAALYLLATLSCTPTVSSDVAPNDAGTVEAGTLDDVAPVDVAVDAQTPDVAAVDVSSVDVAVDAGDLDAAVDTQTPDAQLHNADVNAVDVAVFPDALGPDVAIADPFLEREVCRTNYQQNPQSVGSVDDALIEVSGIVPSAFQAGVLWMHADSGNEPLIHAVSLQGQTLARFAPHGLDAEDLEDIAAAACPFDQNQKCLYVSDTGNNSGTRDNLGIIIFEEPSVDVNAVVEQVQPITGATRLSLSYPGDEGVDVEALMVSPDGSALYLFEKVDAANARVFVAYAPFEENTELSVLTTIRSPGLAIRLGRAITAADMHPSESRLLLRTYTGIFEYRLASDQSMADLAQVTATTVTFGPFSEAQGEALSYDESGRGLWSISEDPAGATGQPLHHYDCNGQKK